MEKEYKVGEIFKYKDCYLRVQECGDCRKCFFNIENYPFVKLTDRLCFKDKNIKSNCSSFARYDGKEVIYKRLS